MSLSCALWATSLQQWARRYIHQTQPARCSPEKRARIRAFFANGVDTMHVPWAVEGLPTLLHLSLFLFFGGLAVFLFNVDQEVFTCVLLWIVFFSIVYGLVTLLPFIRHDSPYNTPLSIIARFLYRFFHAKIRFLYVMIRFLYARIQYLALKVFVHYRDRYWRNRLHGRYSLRRYGKWRNRMDRRLNRLKSVSVRVEKKADESAEDQSSEIDLRILDWTISALGDDDSLEKFFEAIPGFFSSKLVKDLERDFPVSLLKTFWGALDGFIDRNSSSNSVTESVKSRRDIICVDIMSTIPCPDYDICADIMSTRPNQPYHSRRSYFHLYEAPVSIERLQAMARWFTHSSSGISDFARNYVVWHLPRFKLEERDDRWIMLARTVYGVEADMRDMRDMGRDNMLLDTVIKVSREADSFYHNFLMLEFVGALTEFDPRHTLPRLQLDFCTLWNKLVEEANRWHGYIGSHQNLIVLELSQLHLTLHLASASRPYIDFPYPLCDIARHRLDLTTHVPDHNSPADSPLTSPFVSGISRRAKELMIISGPPSPSHPTTPSKIGDNFQVPAATSPILPVDAGPHPTPTDASPPSALQDDPPASTLSCPLEGTILLDIAAPCAEPDTSAILPTPPTPAPTLPPQPVPEFTPHVLNKPSISYDADAASASDPLPSASSVVDFSFPASFPPSRVLPLPNAELLALLDGTTAPGPTGNALPHLRARGLVNNGSMCFANAVFQLLVYSPPLWNLFRQLGDLKGQRGGGLEPGGCATPLVDAMIRFFEEFVSEDKEPPPTQQLLQQPETTKGKAKEGEVEKKDNEIVNSFEPTYLYEAMKEKRQLKHLLVRTRCPYAYLMLICAGLPCEGWQTRGCRRVSRPLPGRTR